MEITKQLLEELYITQGLSTKEIADKLNIGKTTVNRRFKKYKIPIREFKSLGEANVLSNLVSLCPRCHGTVEQNGMDFEFYIV